MIPVPTQGHILTALDYLMDQDQVHRNVVPCGSMMKYPASLPAPAGWIRATGGPIDRLTFPRLHDMYQGRLPDDPDFIVKL